MGSRVVYFLSPHWIRPKKISDLQFVKILRQRGPNFMLYTYPLVICNYYFIRYWARMAQYEQRLAIKLTPDMLDNINKE